MPLPEFQKEYREILTNMLDISENALHGDERAIQVLGTGSSIQRSESVTVVSSCSIPSDPIAIVPTPSASPTDAKVDRGWNEQLVKTEATSLCAIFSNLRKKTRAEKLEKLEKLVERINILAKEWNEETDALVKERQKIKEEWEKNTQNEKDKWEKEMKNNRDEWEKDMQNERDEWVKEREQDREEWEKEMQDEREEREKEMQNDRDEKGES